MRVWADDERLVYCGRIDRSKRREPVFVFPCTFVKMRFTGEVLKIFAANKRAYWDNYLGCSLDGKQLALRLPENGDTVFQVPVDAAKGVGGVHEVMVFKRQDACHELVFSGFEIADDAEVLTAEEEPARKIEVYGDSVSAGEVSEAVAYVGKPDPAHNGEYSNSWYSYAWMTARKLGAQIHDIAQGGIALLPRTGWFSMPDTIGMEEVWDKVHYNPAFGKPMQWDFRAYIPQVVIVAIGQNDNHPEDHMKDDYGGEKAIKWRSHYKGFLKKLREKYPEAHIICITTLLGHDAVWDKAIGEAVAQTGDKKITQFLFKRNGAGTPGHLRIPEAEEMAEELTAYIESLHIEGWETL